MFLVAAIALFVSMILVLVRLYAGPIVYDRVLAANLFGTLTVLFIAILKFFRYRALGDIPQIKRGKQ